MTDRTHTWLRTLALTACAFLFLAASCERKKDTEPKEAASTTDVSETDAGAHEADAGTVMTAHGVFQKKSPKAVGPEAPAIFMLSALKGYTEPCGCTLDVMLGGIDRIAGYVKDARELYPDVTFVDGGDTFFETKTIEEHALAQENARVELVANGLREMGIQFTVPGEKDFALGTARYAELLGLAGLEPVAANLEVDGLELAAKKTVSSAFDTLYVGVVDPAQYDGIEGVTASKPRPALEKLRAEIDQADVAVLLVHGDVPFAKKMLEAAPGADFALVGHGPRETDQADESDGGHTLEPYDQGRYLGILKLFNAKGAAGTDFSSARAGSKAELDKIKRQIEHVNESINKIPPAETGEEPAVLLTLRKRLERLEARRDEIKSAALEVPDDRPAFAWQTVAMEPGYEPDEKIAAAKAAYNRKLRELNDVDREVPPVPDGAAEFIGSNQCATCHSPAMEFWKKTKHAGAVQTLQERHKAFDQKCIGCHVVGYERPGGSVLGKLEYDAKVDIGPQTVELHKDLRNVGCESCHGPGLLHRGAPLDGEGNPQHIIADPTEAECQQCHVPEHSPRFRYDVYVEEITGPGHARD